MTIFKHLSISLLCLLPALSPGDQERAQPEAAKPQEKITGLWRGVYTYPNNGQDPVKFNLILIQTGETVVGFAREANTFGERREPWLHAVIKGTFNEKTGKLTCTKTYDGTAGPIHPVEYVGQLDDGGIKIEGTWAIDGAGAEFTLSRVANTRSGAFSGVWAGTYHYPKDSGIDSVDFKMLMIHDGQKLVGFIKEPNTFGNKNEPWLQSRLKGRFDDKSGKISFTKSYDGTAGEDHDVEYNGDVSRDRKSFDGVWNLRDELNGRFTLKKLPLDATTLELLK